MRDVTERHDHRLKPLGAFWAPFLLNLVVPEAMVLLLLVSLVGQ